MVDYNTLLSPIGRQLQDSAIRQMGPVGLRAADLVSFAHAFPDVALFPWTELRAIAAGLLSGTDGAALQYGHARGYAPLLDAIREISATRGIDASSDELLVTTGSQQGLELTAHVLVGPGEVVLVELPTYTGAIAAFSSVQARLAGVRQDEDGIDLEDLDAVWRHERACGRTPKLLYLMPNFQNPTGVLLSLDKRRQLIAWADRRDVMILEDDAYASLHFADGDGEQQMRPMMADDNCGRVMYLSTFSKTLAPGFRVGWMVAPAPLIERCEAAKVSIDLASGMLDQRIVHEAITRGVITSRVPFLRAAYRRKRDAMERALRDHLGDQLHWHSPQGGFFLWAALPEDCIDTALLARAAEQRLVFVPGSTFYVDGKGHDHIRLSYSASSLEQIQQGVERLSAAVLAAEPARTV